MKSLRVNADYELELFTGNRAPQIVNQSIEFLALYLESKPLYTIKNYSKEFIEHVEEITGNKPKFVNQGEYDNWWGPLKRIEIEKKLNSKLWSSQFNSDSQIVDNISQLKLRENQRYVAKNPFGMSGQKFVTFIKGEEQKLEALIKENLQIVIEPLLHRVHDFSLYIFPNGFRIFYKNFVDENFQYKGTVFTQISAPILSSLPFYRDISLEEWEKFDTEVERIIDLINETGDHDGFSIDSFIYEDEGKLKIRTISEINFRRTMGSLAWLLSQKFKQRFNWSALVLGKFLKRDLIFSDIKKKIESLPNCIYLSPGDTRFEVFLLLAEDDSSGKKLFEKIKLILPNCQFAIEI